MTADHIPKIVALGPRALSIHGYSGRGIAPGTLFGKAAAAYLTSGDESALPLEPIAAWAEAGTAVKAAWYELGASALHLIGARRATA
jgi:hypothetical protein